MVPSPQQLSKQDLVAMIINRPLGKFCCMDGSCSKARLRKGVLWGQLAGLCHLINWVPETRAAYSELSGCQKLCLAVCQLSLWIPQCLCPCADLCPHGLWWTTLCLKSHRNGSQTHTYHLPADSLRTCPCRVMILSSKPLLSVLSGCPGLDSRDTVSQLSRTLPALHDASITCHRAQDSCSEAWLFPGHLRLALSCLPELLPLPKV